MAPTTVRSEHSDHLSVATLDERRSPARAQRTRDLLLRAQRANPADRQRLHEEVVVLNTEVAESLVQRYRNRGIPLEDLVQVACVGLVKAAQGFDATKGDNFLGYAVPTILGEVKRFFRDNAWTVRPPRRIQELQAEIAGANEQITQESGHNPSQRDVASYLGVPLHDVHEAMSAVGCFSPNSLDRQVGEEEGPALSSVVGDDDAGFARVEAAAMLRPLCRRLSRRDQRIIYLRFFHEWTQARIAEELGVTQMQVSRLLSRILRQLRTQLSTPNETNVASGTDLTTTYVAS